MASNTYARLLTPGSDNGTRADVLNDFLLQAHYANSALKHVDDTTGVHGITDTALLETTAGAQARVDTYAAIANSKSA